MTASLLNSAFRTSLDYLILQKHEVHGLDSYAIGRYKHQWIKKIDLLDKERVDQFVREYQPEILYHLAAFAHEGLSQFCPLLITENNYNAYLNILVPAIKYGVKRIILCSSMSVYGNQEPPFNELMPRKPQDVYAISKTAMEEVTEILAKVYCFEYVIIRPHNVYGSRQGLYDPYRNVVGIFINRLLARKPFYIYGDGEQRRAFSYIDDVVPYLAKAGFADVSREIINIGPNEEYTINYLASELLKHFPDSPKPIHLPDRPLEVKDAWCDNFKAEVLLDYKTSVTFEEGIAEMVKWAKKVGHQKPQYLMELELVTGTTPETWVNKLL